MSSAGQVLALISSGAAATRSEIAALTGFARSTVSQRVEALLAHGFLTESADGHSAGGRPSRRLRLRTEHSVVIGVDLGATHCRIALADIGGTELAVVEEALHIAAGPQAVLEHVATRARELMEQSGQPPSALRAIGVGVPGPVEFATGQPVDPPIMPGWHQFPIPRFFADRFGVHALVDNDVNVMALAEQRHVLRDVQHLLFIKMGTGIGCGIVAHGQIYRGAVGSAGDIGHIKVAPDGARCRCGNHGCLEAVAGGAALARRLTELGVPASCGQDVARLVKSGDQEAVRLVREAGRTVGEVLSGLINFFNPAALVLGGALSTVHEHLLAGVREVIYARSHPLSTERLLIEPSGLRENAAALGAALLAIEFALSPHRVDSVVAGTASPPGHPGGDTEPSRR